MRTSRVLFQRGTEGGSTYFLAAFQCFRGYSALSRMSSRPRASVARVSCKWYTGLKIKINLLFVYVLLKQCMIPPPALYFIPLWLVLEVVTQVEIDWTLTNAPFPFTAKIEDLLPHRVQNILWYHFEWTFSRGTPSHGSAHEYEYKYELYYSLQFMKEIQ